MPSYKTEAIRTIALVGQTTAGKTSLTEALLFKAGVIGAPGSQNAGRRCATSTRAKESTSTRSIPP
jgi:translation elongation factor EF-G